MSPGQSEHPPADNTESYSRSGSNPKVDSTLTVPSFTDEAFQESALDPDALYAGSNLSLDAVPAGKQSTSERIRRRSDVSRFRVPDSPPLFRTRGADFIDDLPDGVELPVLTYISEEVHDSAGGATQGSGPVVSRATGGGRPGDLENLGGIELAAVGPSVTGGSADLTIPGPTVVSEEQSHAFRRLSRIHFGAMCYCLFLEGWNDGSTGPLLPVIQKHYGIGYAIVSLLFVFNCIGFISGALMNIYLNDRLGMGKVLVLGAILQLVGYGILAPAGPFPVMCLAFLFTGFGIALQNAQANGYVGGLREHVSMKFGLMHASYGFGALCAPLVATQFAGTSHWSYHYLISAAIGVTNTCVLIYVFRFKHQDVITAEEGETPTEDIAGTVMRNKYRQVLGLGIVHWLSLFSLIYVGVEVTLGGWIVTFIEQKRGGGPNAGYISSGFFGGLMLGRISLMWLNQKLGARRAIFFYAFIVILLEITIWFTPSLLENALAISFIGLLLGPMYPLLMRHSTQVLPPWLLTPSVGYIAGLGQAGSAAVPVVMGAVASKWGIGALQPFVVSMVSTMMVVWVFVPRVRRVD